MFYNAHAFNQDISSWNVSKVSTMSYMFYNAHAFNQDIDSWDISSLTNAAGMFKGTSMTVDNMDNTLRGWAKLDTAAGESTANILVKSVRIVKHTRHSTHLTSIPTANILIKGMCVHAFNQDIDSWDISSLTNAAGMFKGTAMTVDNMDNTLRG
jgi:surface protein